MRFAAVADIHGNLLALEAVIADFKREGLTHVVNLGDSLSGPLWPAETAERLIGLDWLTISGNHDRQVLTASIADINTSDGFAAAQLTPSARAWIAALPSICTTFDSVLLCHGTPTSDTHYWLHRGGPGSMRHATIPEISQDATSHKLALCGHTHVPRVIALPDGRIVANPGSVGLPSYDSEHVREKGGPLARYLIAEECSTGWNIELRGVAYDFERACKKSEETNRKNWAHTLRTGQVLK